MATALSREISAVDLLEFLHRQDFHPSVATSRLAIQLAAASGRAAAALRHELLAVPGVFAVDADVEHEAAWVVHLPEQAIVDACRNAVALAGFEAGEFVTNGHEDPDTATRARYEALTRQWAFAGLGELWVRACRAAVVALDLATAAGALSPNEAQARRKAIGSERELVAMELRELGGAQLVRPTNAGSASSR